jgi:3-hydroxyisobutyrate dehydrogenase-like beta-hydroxyacid dehydrogenase
MYSGNKSLSLAPTAKDAMEASPLVILCLLNYDILYKVLQFAPSDLSGKTLVNLSNGTPDEARKLATWAAEHKLAYLDGGNADEPSGNGKTD